MSVKVNKLHTLYGHNDCIFALSEGIESNFFYTGAGDGLVVQWDLNHPKDGKLIAKLPHSVYALTVAPEKKLLFLGHNFEGIHVIDLENNKEIWSLKLTQSAIFDLKVIGDILYVATGDGVLILVDLNNRQVIKHLKLSHKSLRVLAYHKKNNQLAIGNSEHQIVILDLLTHTPIYQLSGHTNSVFALAYSPDGSCLISGGRDAHLLTWETDTYKQKHSVVAHMFAINYLAFREDGEYFVTCSMDKSIKVWKSDNHQLIKVIDKARHAGHGTSINKVKWSKHHQQIISVSDDRTISIWEIEI
jgi:WD repeat-containing protein 61